MSNFSFNELKRSSSNSFDKLNQELSKLNTGGFDNSADNRIWKLTVDKAGNGYAVIRFLPAPSGEDVPFVRIFSHGFQGPGGWYIENSLSTFGNDVADPVAEMNRQLWNEGEGSQGRKFVQGAGGQAGSKRKLNYYTNIYVVNDPANPANNGKVFLYKFGKKIWDKLNDLMHPQFEDEKPVNPFDFWEGANFKLKQRKFEGYPNYDKSEFETPGPLLEDDEELERIWKSQYSLQELLDKKNFKTYDQLKTRLDRAMGNAPAATQARRTVVEDDDVPFDTTPAPAFKAAQPQAAPAQSVDEDDDEFAFFKSLADDD